MSLGVLECKGEGRNSGRGVCGVGRGKIRRVLCVEFLFIG